MRSRSSACSPSTRSRRSPSLVARSVSGAWVARSAASSPARAITASASSTTSETRPAAFASSASISRAVKMISRTRASPRIATSRDSEVTERQFPSVRAMGKPKRSRRSVILRSQQAAMAAPPPVQAPVMAATVGTLQRSIRSSTRSIFSS